MEAADSNSGEEFHNSNFRLSDAIRVDLERPSSSPGAPLDVRTLYDFLTRLLVSGVFATH